MKLTLFLDTTLLLGHETQEKPESRSLAVIHGFLQRNPWVDVVLIDERKHGEAPGCSAGLFEPFVRMQIVGALEMPVSSDGEGVQRAIEQWMLINKPGSDQLWLAVVAGSEGFRQDCASLIEIDGLSGLVERDIHSVEEWIARRLTTEDEIHRSHYRRPMSARNKASLISRFPRLLLKLADADPSDPFSYGIECGDGWYNLLQDLLSRLTDLSGGPDAQVVVVRVREKFGAMRVHIEAGAPEHWALVHWARDESEHVCEACGHSGTVLVSSGCVMTRCEKHAPPGAMPRDEFLRLREARQRAG